MTGISPLYAARCKAARSSRCFAHVALHMVVPVLLQVEKEEEKRGDWTPLVSSLVISAAALVYPSFPPSSPTRYTHTHFHKLKHTCPHSKKKKKVVEVGGSLRKAPHLFVCALLP